MVVNSKSGHKETVQNIFRQLTQFKYVSRQTASNCKALCRTYARLVRLVVLTELHYQFSDIIMLLYIDIKQGYFRCLWNEM